MDQARRDQGRVLGRGVLEEIALTGQGGAHLRALIAHPDGEVERGVLVVHEDAGLDARARGLALQCAAAGFVALVPDLWSREGKPGKPAELPDRRALADLDAAALWLAAQPGMGPRSIGALGCGPGGTLAFQLACTSRTLGALAAIEADPVHAELDALRPIQPLELALNLDIAAFFAFLAERGGVPEAHVENVRRMLTSAAKDFEIARVPSRERAVELALAFLGERL